MMNIGKEKGFFLIDKPYGWTSFDVVNKIRKDIQVKTGTRYKIGHAGTLDPLATGLLILCYGSETKKISEFQFLEKEYIARFTFGSTTLCFDLEKPISRYAEYLHITENDFRNMLKDFTGEQYQIPPSFSAKQVDGKRAYNYARKGQHVEIKPSKITIWSLELLEFKLPDAIVRIVCSSGTYIRALARDFGEKFNSCSHLSELRRTRIGSFQVDSAIKPEEIKIIIDKW